MWRAKIVGPTGVVTFRHKSLHEVIRLVDTMYKFKIPEVQVRVSIMYRKEWN